MNVREKINDLAVMFKWPRSLIDYVVLLTSMLPPCSKVSGNDEPIASVYWFTATDRLTGRHMYVVCDFDERDPLDCTVIIVLGDNHERQYVSLHMHDFEGIRNQLEMWLKPCEQKMAHLV